MMRLSSVVACGAVLLTTACYDYIPVETAPPAGKQVALDITDRGRVALGDRFGPGLARIEGTLVSSAGPEYVINVHRVAQVSGSSALWSGEETRLNRDFVGSVRTRQLSKLRTTLLVGGIAIATGALAAKGLAGSLSQTEENPEPKTPISIRIPIHP